MTNSKVAEGSEFKKLRKARALAWSQRLTTFPQPTRTAEVTAAVLAEKFKRSGDLSPRDLKLLISSAAETAEQRLAPELIKGRARRLGDSADDWVIVLVKQLIEGPEEEALTEEAFRLLRAPPPRAEPVKPTLSEVVERHLNGGAFDQVRVDLRAVLEVQDWQRFEAAWQGLVQLPSQPEYAVADSGFNLIYRMFGKLSRTNPHAFRSVVPEGVVKRFFALFEAFEREACWSVLIRADLWLDQVFGNFVTVRRGLLMNRVQSLTKGAGRGGISARSFTGLFDQATEASSNAEVKTKPDSVKALKTLLYLMRLFRKELCQPADREIEE